jgi:hypothetical protein
VEILWMIRSNLVENLTAKIFSARFPAGSDWFAGCASNFVPRFA